jgi:hypothetical protein
MPPPDLSMDPRASAARLALIEESAIEADVYRAGRANRIAAPRS